MNWTDMGKMVIDPSDGYVTIGYVCPTCHPIWFGVMPPPPCPVHDGVAAMHWPFIPQDDVDTHPIDISTPVDVSGNPDPFTVPIQGGRWCWIPDDVVPDEAAYDGVTEVAGSDPRPSFDWTLRYGTIRGARVGVPYSIHEEDVARIVTEIDALVRRYRLRLATLTLDKDT